MHVYRKQVAVRIRLNTIIELFEAEITGTNRENVILWLGKHETFPVCD